VIGQDWKGRLYDILFMFTAQARRARKASEILFQLSVQNDPHRRAQLVSLKAVCEPDDEGKPCLTLMTPAQD